MVSAKGGLNVDVLSVWKCLSLQRVQCIQPNMYSREQIRKLRTEGKSIRQIQKELGISSPSVVQYHLDYKKRTWLEKEFILPERFPPPGDKDSELMCAGFNEYRRILLEKIESQNDQKTK